MTAVAQDRPLTARARDALRRAGNPFRNYFARNPDDEVCARYHVPELFAAERDLLHGIIDLYRYDPHAHSEVVPVLGNKGAGKTHLLHSIKHGTGGQWQLLVTPGVYQKDTDFLEYLLFQIIDTLLGGGRQKGTRPLAYVGDQLVRRQVAEAVKGLSADEQMDLFPPPGLGKWGKRLGLGAAQAGERAEWLAATLNPMANFGKPPAPLAQALADSGLTPEKACELLTAHALKTEARNTAGVMRRHLVTGFARAVLLGDEAELANFLTYGFAELEFQVRPGRQDLVLALFKVLTDLFCGLKVPVVVAFDQLEDLLLARRSDDAHKTAETFFAGIVQVMHQIDGLLFVIFAERGLWNRFVPSLDGYIQDRLNNPVHVPKVGTVKAIRLEAPTPGLTRQVVEARLRPVLAEVPDGGALPGLYPFVSDQVDRIARTEPTLRDMLQQFRHLFDHLIYEEGQGDSSARQGEEETGRQGDETPAVVEGGAEGSAVGMDDEPIDAPAPVNRLPAEPTNRIDALLGEEAPTVNFKSVALVETPADTVPETAAAEVPPAPTFPTEAVPAAPLVNGVRASSSLSPEALADLWDQEFRAAKRKLEPDGALTGATRELQAALGTFLTTCHEHGVKIGPWRLQHVVPEWPFGDHPTYGAVTLAHWACKDGQPWKVGVGLFLARGAGKPKDLEIKLSVMDIEPQVVDHLILLRPEDDLSLSGKSKAVWAEAEKKGKHARLEPVGVDGYALLYSVPRWLAAVREDLPGGTPVPNLADVIQEKAEGLLAQVCMPVTQ